MNSEANQDRFKAALLEHVMHLVNESTGIKLGDLSNSIWHIFLKKDHELNKALEALGTQNLIEELVQLKKIIEIEYILPDGSLKTFYLPARTQINIRGQESKTFRV